MMRIITALTLSALLVCSAFAEGTHLDVMVPELMDTDLTGPVKSVDMKTSVNVSGEFERSYKEYDREGNLLIEAEWDPEGERISCTTNYYNEETGSFVRQLYMDYEDEYTNDWRVILNPDTRQIAMKKANGAAAIYTYSPEKYLIQFKYVGSDKKLRKASFTKRDENNRAKEYTRMDDRKKPLYTYWFKWKDDGTIDRERQKYRQEDGERLHVYDYLKTDEQGNWTQRLMVRYDIGGKEKEKVFERVVTRTITYFGDEEGAEEPETVVADASPETDGSESTNLTALAETSNSVAEVTAAAAETPEGTLDETETPGGAGDPVAADDSTDPDPATTTGSSDEFDYTFDDISDKLVIVSCKSDIGRSAGSGFVAEMDGKKYLFTNQHVIMGADTIQFRTADGETLQPRRVELSMTRDIARILIDDRDGFEISERIALGNRVGVFGNSEGAGVATELFGKVTDMGTDLVEVTAEFVSGNSGSPVLDKNREVIGIASYVQVFYDPDEEEGEDEEKDEDNEEEEVIKSKTRRFCYRMTDLKWKPVKWKKYNDKYGKLHQSCNNLSANVFEIIGIWAEAPTDKIPYNDNMAYDLGQWVKRHNDIIDRVNRRGYKKRAFLNAYSDSLETLADTCTSRARRAKMFSSQRELTGFLREEFEKNSLSLEYAAWYFRQLAEEILDQ